MKRRNLVWSGVLASLFAGLVFARGHEVEASSPPTSGVSSTLVPGPRSLPAAPSGDPNKVIPEPVKDLGWVAESRE